MEQICLFCKSYLLDLERAHALVESVRRFNSDQLKFFVSVPRSELKEFKAQIGSQSVEWVTDEDVVSETSLDSEKKLSEMPGNLTQQVVKSEFWRMGFARNYVCLDSDSVFIRPFGEADFFAPDGVPYTVLHEAKAFRQICASHGLESVLRDFDAEKKAGQELFGREGVFYNFGPLPVIWSGLVWKSLAERYLSERNWSMFDAIRAHPHEATWYGEALLSYGVIPVYPREPLFKAYLFLEEYELDRRMNITIETLARDYLGVVYQSNWYPKRLGIGKNLAYKAKKRLRALRGKS